MLREQIKRDIAKAIKQLTVNSSQLMEEKIEVTRTADPKFGDYTTNVALRLRSGSSTSKQSPLEVAKVLSDSLKDLPYVERLEVAGPGFINFFIKSEVWQKQVADVLNLGEKYGSNQVGKGKKARVEFVSANPTGPLHFGNARGGPIGDTLASVLHFSGYDVIREYYHNDVGVQVAKLGQSILNVAAGRPLEEQEYKGEYIKEFANKIKSQIIEKTRPTGITSPSLDWDRLGKEAVERLLTEIIADCEAMGIKFDQVYSESGFIESGKTEKAISKLAGKGLIKDQDDAKWFAPNDEFLKDRETVVVKSDGSYTYFANDIAYHDLKFKDNPAVVIDVWGANHHGHVPRLQAAISALGYDVSKFYVILYQWVRFKRGKEVVKMSKRAGTFVTAREVLDEVGRDALRFFILMYDPNSHIDFDLDLAKKKSKENPVYYVQYAHARICSILAKSKVKRVSFPDEKQKSKVDCQLLTINYELDLIKQITRLPELVEDISRNFAVHRLTAYATELADSFHRFYENCRVIPALTRGDSSMRGGGEEEDLMQARISLIMATKTVLTNTLKLLGISAPEKM